MKLDTVTHDLTQIFLVYMSLCGDADKTALALDLDVAHVVQLAQDQKWVDKVRRISVMSKSGTPGDWERAQNRALNFVQAHQFRKTLDGVIAHLATLKPAKILETLNKNGDLILSARVLTELAKSMQAIHEVTYAALGDSARERSDRPEDSKGPNANGLHAALIAALNSSTAPKASEKLVDEVVAKVEALRDAKPTDAQI